MFANPIARVMAALLSGMIVAALAPAAASAQLQTVGLGGWQVASSARAGSHGARISKPGFSTRTWLKVRPDNGGAVGTEVNALVQNGRCPNVFFSANMKSCFGYMSTVGPETIPQFAVPWWFRSTFRAGTVRGRHEQLIVNGVVGEADVWVNGVRLATHHTVQGAYTRFTFDVTRLVHRGRNAVALEVWPNDPTKMFTLDNVDWTQIPPDNNTGIQFPIQLHTTGALGLSDVHAVQHDAPSLSSANLVLKGVVSNPTRARRTGLLTATLIAPNGSARRFVRSIRVAGGRAKTVAIHVHVAHPAVWWPYAMGSQPLYRVRMAVSGAGLTDAATQTFGIRTITTRLIGASLIAPQGSRQFLVNGRPFVFRGGGWSEDLFLRYSKADTANQIAMIKNLGLNGIRTEGKQMPDDFYAQFDRAGLLIDAGYQCCDAWQLQDSKLTSRHDFAILKLSAHTIGANLRNHPSVLNFSWSDNEPTPTQERVSIAGFRGADFQEPLIASAEYKSSPRLGPSGEKEGPYDWVPPSYWYDTTHFDPNDPTRTNVGGAWAFDSEAGAGHTVPTLDSIHRFLSPFEQTQLWTNPDFNQYHANYEPGLPDPNANGGYSFGTLHDLDQAITNRYGGWSSLAGYVQEAQVQNYETQRAQFEAYIAHSTRKQAPSTGVVYWQLNKGWPTLLWDLYNHDFDQAGSYFGAKKANEALHVLYTYDTGSVDVDNLGAASAAGLSVAAKVYGVDGHPISSSAAHGITVAPQGVATGVLHPTVPAATTPPKPAQAYFVELLLTRGSTVVDRNVYWLSTQADVVNWPKTMGLPQATMTQYASLAQLRGLPTAHLAVKAHTHAGTGLNGADTVTDVTITNVSPKSTVGFFLRADVRRGTVAGVPATGDNQVLPIFWDDNDVTLWPGESVTLHGSYKRSALRGAAPVVSLTGWNRPTLDVPAS